MIRILQLLLLFSLAAPSAVQPTPPALSTQVVVAPTSSITRFLRAHQQKFYTLALIGTVGYIGLVMYEKSRATEKKWRDLLKPIATLVDHINTFTQGTAFAQLVSDLRTFVRGNGDEVPQSVTQMFKLLSTPAAQEFLHKTQQTFFGQGDPANPQFTPERIAAVLNAHPRLTALLTEKITESYVRAQRDPQQSSSQPSPPAGQLQNRPPAMSSILWVLMRRPTAAFRGAWWGAMQNVTVVAQQSETPTEQTEGAQ